MYFNNDVSSILLDNDCKRMLRRNSKKAIINYVLEKLSQDTIKESMIDNSNENTTGITYNYNFYNNTENTNNTNNKNDNYILYEFILTICGCNNI